MFSDQNYAIFSLTVLKSCNSYYIYIVIFSACCTGGCHNGGVCIDPEVCQCPNNWQGQYCKIGEACIRIMIIHLHLRYKVFCPSMYMPILHPESVVCKRTQCIWYDWMYWVGHAFGVIRLVSPLPTGPPVLLLPAGSPPKWGPHNQFWLWQIQLPNDDVMLQRHRWCTSRILHCSKLSKRSWHLLEPLNTWLSPGNINKHLPYQLTPVFVPSASPGWKGSHCQLT